MTNSVAPQVWEVWHARFDFSEGKGYKYRPVIVVEVAEDGSIVMMVASATNKLNLEHDYLINDWKAAGLDKPSIARADRIARIPADTSGRQAASGGSPMRTLPQLPGYSLRLPSRANSKNGL